MACFKASLILVLLLPSVPHLGDRSRSQCVSYLLGTNHPNTQWVEAMALSFSWRRGGVRTKVPHKGVIVSPSFKSLPFSSRNPRTSLL